MVLVGGGAMASPAFLGCRYINKYYYKHKKQSLQNMVTGDTVTVTKLQKSAVHLDLQCNVSSIQCQQHATHISLSLCGYVGRYSRT